MHSLGTNLEFLSEPPPDYLCPVCTDPLTEPYLTDCGHHFCYTCRGRMIASGKAKCPECREHNVLVDARLNKHLQRQVNSLKVRCQHHEVGCQWVGELRYLQEHLDPVTRKCGFILLACPLGCGERVCSSAMKDHILSGCSKRPYDCKYCGYYKTFDIVIQQHYPLCEMFPVKCPNECSVENLKRIQFEKHLEQCPLQVIQCPFASAGCTVQLPRREMEEHEKDLEVMRQHLEMAKRMMSGLKPLPPPSLVTDCLQFVINLPPVDFMITDFSMKNKCETKWTSPSFYSHPQGYKLCLVVYPNGVWSGKSTHVSVFVGVLNGEHNDHLNRPLDTDVIVELLNWKEDKEHHERTISYTSRDHRISQGGIEMSPVFNMFISHLSLSYNSTTNTEYLQNDCVRLRVSKVILYSTALLNKTPSWQNPGYQSLHEFTLTEFSKRKQFNNRFYSSPFYTHEYGYRLCLVVYSNGYDSGKDTHVSVFLHLTLMAGEYDDQLRWPFCSVTMSKIRIHIRYGRFLNWREQQRSPQEETLAAYLVVLAAYLETVHFLRCCSSVSQRGVKTSPGNFAAREQAFADKRSRTCKSHGDRSLSSKAL